MLLLFTYILIALCFSFLCSICEAVILSTTPAHILVLEQQGKPSARRLRELKQDINRPLAAILILNTIAHTIGAAGAGAQAAATFGNAYVGITAVILTVLILVFSEIIPKTLGSYYWKELAPATAYCLRILIWLLAPLVWLSERLTRNLVHDNTLTGFSRGEFVAMADLGREERQLAKRETIILKNLLLLHETSVKAAMTPISVVFKLPQSLSVGEFFQQHENTRFSRIPIHGTEPDQVTGFVLRSDLLLEQARGNSAVPLSCYRRELPSILDSMPISRAFEESMRMRAHIMLVVNEYGGLAGVLTLEDILETLLGLEIVDEGDRIVDMQKLARDLWKHRAREMGLDIQE